jgi:DMSO/TMAO reductase YedYZ molybdopterin-dependent catalytic subunit
LFYLRNHFPIPRLAASDWRLSVEGEVRQPLQLGYGELRALPSRTLLVTVECAGNGRLYLHPGAEGEPWQYGAVSTAEWTGVPLHVVLEQAGLTERAREIVVEGADRGRVGEAGTTIAYARGLPPAKALDPDTVLASAMNGELLAPEHGFPVRLVVPGWYGMAAVKWVTRLRAVAEPFRGFYQVDRYVMAHPERGETQITPLAAMRVRSLITWPPAGATLQRGEHTLRGLAWAGAAPSSRGEVSAGGERWQPATLTSRAERYAWRRWELPWRATTPGPITLRSRAFDEAGDTQPVEAEWNRLGYANNAIQTVDLTVA